MYSCEYLVLCILTRLARTALHPGGRTAEKPSTCVVTVFHFVPSKLKTEKRKGCQIGTHTVSVQYSTVLQLTQIHLREETRQTGNRYENRCATRKQEQSGS